jgi:hypothetical protein
MGKLNDLWNNRAKILEGIKNTIFFKKDVEAVYELRIAICKRCPFYDKIGTSCTVPGTYPCCAHCGCSLAFKTRSLSSGCPINRWEAVLTQQEEEESNRSDK